MKQLNFDFRKKNIATDVLAWQHYQKTTLNKIKKDNFVDDFPFGEIAICADICQEQASQNNLDFGN